MSWAEAINIDVNCLSSWLVWLEGLEHWDRTRCQAEPFWLSDVYPRFKPLKFGCHWVMKRSWRSPFQRKFKSSLSFGGSKSEGFEKIGNVSLESYSQSFEETRRIQDPVNLHITKPQRQLIGLESNIYKCANIIFFSLQLPPFYQSSQWGPFFLFCIKIGLTIYISLARIVIE